MRANWSVVAVAVSCCSVTFLVVLGFSHFDFCLIFKYFVHSVLDWQAREVRPNRELRRKILNSAKCAAPIKKKDS